jgi:uncharacterized membrane protein YkgB
MARSFLLQSEREYKVRFVTKILTKLGLLEEDLDYHFMHASMVIIFLFCGYQKWFDCEAQRTQAALRRFALLFNAKATDNDSFGQTLAKQRLRLTPPKEQK